MKYSGFHFASHLVASVVAVLFGAAAGLPNKIDFNLPAMSLIMLAVALFLIPYGRRFVLFKIFEWERHEDNDQPSGKSQE